MAIENQVTYALDEAVDFVIIGSGSAGGILAKEMSVNGFKVVVLEQGPFRTAEDFTHDSLDVFVFGELTGGGSENHQQTFRHDESEVAVVSPGRQAPAFYAQTVGGTGQSVTPTWSLTTRGSTGRLVFPAHRARMTRLDQDPFRHPRFPSSRQAS